MATKTIAEQVLHIKTSTAALILLAIINVAVIGPGGWIVSGWVKKIQDLEASVDGLSRELHSDFLPKEDYQGDWEGLQSRLSDMDGKLSDVMILIASGKN